MLEAVLSIHVVDLTLKYNGVVGFPLSINVLFDPRSLG